jgi:hypothetical protein
MSVLSSRDKELDAFRHELEDEPNEFSEVILTESFGGASGEQIIQAPLTREEVFPFDEEVSIRETHLDLPMIILSLYSTVMRCPGNVHRLKLWKTIAVYLPQL